MNKTRPAIRKWHVYLANLNPGFKAEPGKVRPIVVIQTDLLNNVHPTTIVCPITSKIHSKASVLRVHLPKNEAGLPKASDILVDQIRAIDNSRIVKEIGKLEKQKRERLRESIENVLQ